MFDVRTAKVPEGSARLDLKTFPLRVREGKISVDATQVQKSSPLEQGAPKGLVAHPYFPLCLADLHGLHGFAAGTHRTGRLACFSDVAETA